jgi:hypothetical protein
MPRSHHKKKDFFRFLFLFFWGFPCHFISKNLLFTYIYLIYGRAWCFWGGTGHSRGECNSHDHYTQDFFLMQRNDPGCRGRPGESCFPRSLRPGYFLMRWNGPRCWGKHQSPYTGYLSIFGMPGGPILPDPPPPQGIRNPVRKILVLGDQNNQWEKSLEFCEIFPRILKNSNKDY